MDPSTNTTTTDKDNVQALEAAYRNALAAFKKEKTNKDLRRARTAAKRAWDAAVLNQSGGAQQLCCKDCSQMFLWTKEDQEYYQAAEWNHKPQRCRACAEAQKTRRKNYQQKVEEENNNDNENNICQTVPTTKKAGRNMCYAFQKGNCPYGDRCKFNHDPDFAGKSKDGNEDGATKNETDPSNRDGTNNDDEISSKKRKIVPETIPLCKWGKDCKMKRCRYRHDDTPNATTTSSSTIVKTPVSVESKIPNAKTGKQKGDPETANSKNDNSTIPKNSDTKKTVVLGICKWGKNCTLKRCRFRHVDVPSSKVEETCATIPAPLAKATPKPIVETSKTTKPDKKSQKSLDKKVHKAVSKFLKKAPQHQLKLKDLKKLVRKKLIDSSVEKDQLKSAFKKTIAKHKDSLVLVQDGTIIKLVV